MATAVSAEDESSEAATSSKIDIAALVIGTLKVTRFFGNLPAGTGRGRLGQTTVIAIRNAIAVEFRTRHTAICAPAPG
jgi:hypothetical protein